MVAILRHHVAHILHCLILPLLSADMLPSWNFGEYKQSYFIASVDKILTLRIVRRTHFVESELVLEDVRVFTLNVLWHCITDVRITLVAVESAQFYFFIVEIEAGAVKTDIPKAKTSRHHIDDLVLGIYKLGGEYVEDRMLKTPSLHRRRICRGECHFAGDPGCKLG